MLKPFCIVLLFIPFFTFATSIINCGQWLHINKVPKRAVVHDINMIEMMLALDLQTNLVGISGIPDKNLLPLISQKKLSGIPIISRNSIPIEALISNQVDFVFAGWNYGFRVNGEVTPKKLADLGINSYLLTESCIHVGDKTPASFDDVLYDITNLGRVFQVEHRAEQLVKAQKKRIERLSKRLITTKNKPKVFVYDSGVSAPFTAGGYAMPDAMITLAGGVNVMRQLKGSWLNTQWEQVSLENPDWIIIVNYGEQTADEKITFLKENKALQHFNAIKNNNYFILDYVEVTPGVHNISATERLAKKLHPHQFKS